MKTFLRIICFILLAQPALAEPMNPIQQYLYDESGYAPAMNQPVAPAPQPVTPYNTATVVTPDGGYYYAQPQAQVRPQVDDVNQGALGINN